MTYEYNPSSLGIPHYRRIVETVTPERTLPEPDVTDRRQDRSSLSSAVSSVGSPPSLSPFSTPSPFSSSCSPWSSYSSPQDPRSKDNDSFLSDADLVSGKTEEIHSVCIGGGTQSVPAGGEIHSVAASVGTHSTSGATSEGEQKVPGDGCKTILPGLARPHIVLESTEPHSMPEVTDSHSVPGSTRENLVPESLGANLVPSSTESNSIPDNTELHLIAGSSEKIGNSSHPLTGGVHPICEDGSPCYQLSTLMKEVPPNVVISSHHLLMAPSPTLSSPSPGPSSEEPSSPEQKQSLVVHPKHPPCVPPNVTIKYNNLLPQLRQQETLPLPGSLPWCKDRTCGSVCVPHSFTTPQYSIKVLEPAIGRRTQISDFEWLETSDIVSNTIRKTPLDILLKDPDIVNNQGSSLTKALYVLKGVAHDFRDLRIKSGYTVEEVGGNLRVMYGEEFTGTLVQQFELLLLPLSSFLTVRPTIVKWMRSMRPGQDCMEWNQPIEVRRRRDSSSDSDDRRYCRSRKRTRIELESKELLEKAYQDNPKPNGPSMLALATSIKLDRDVVRVWFANRRQKQKKQMTETRAKKESNQNIERDEETSNIPGTTEEAQNGAAGYLFEDLYETFKNNSHREDFNDQVSQFENNLHRQAPVPNERQRSFPHHRSVIVSSPRSVSDPVSTSLMTPRMDERSHSENSPGSEDWDPVLYKFLG